MKAIKEILEQMTLEEKARLCSGKSFWYLEDYPEYDIPSIMVTDGPNGLRKQDATADHLGLNQSVPATCFPTAVTTASSWDLDLIEEEGEAIAEEALEQEVSVVLGPGTNIKRSPLCGRNFEYFSEDPYLAGKLSSHFVQGVQSKGVGTSLKHFAVNNQERARMVSNSVVDERAKREIYLKPFEICVKESQPWTVMCSYNRVNGTYASEHPELLTDILRDEWGFEGLVVTDWGALNESPKAIAAGLELEMPGPDEYSTEQIVKAVEEGTLPEEKLDHACTLILEMIEKSLKQKQQPYDQKAHHKLAVKIAANSAVLLKNDNKTLPVKEGQSLAVIGTMAKTPRYQGAGSSQIVPHQLDNLCAAFDELNVDYDFAPGYAMEHDEPDEKMIEEAVATAKDKDLAIVVIGLPGRYESEGYDRTHLNLPPAHDALVKAITETGTDVAVVLLAGAPVLMPWRDDVEAILLPYLGGEGGGTALAQILTGEVNPSGKLAETFPLRLEDNPSFLHFAQQGLNVEYRESILVGYRFYDWANKDVAFPFGYGLSYTSFSYDDLDVSWDDETKTGQVKVTITNTGDVAGQEIVQLYQGIEESKIMRAPKELVGFAKVSLEPGESKTVEIALNERSFAYYDVKAKTWQIEQGTYTLYVAASSRDVKLETTLQLDGVTPEASVKYDPDEVLLSGMLNVDQDTFRKLFPGGKLPLFEAPEGLTLNTPLSEALKDPKGKALLEPFILPFQGDMDEEDSMGRMFLAMIKDMPLRSLCMLPGLSRGQLKDAIQ